MLNRILKITHTAILLGLSIYLTACASSKPTSECLSIIPDVSTPVKPVNQVVPKNTNPFSINNFALKAKYKF